MGLDVDATVDVPAEQGLETRPLEPAGVPAAAAPATGLPQSLLADSLRRPQPSVEQEAMRRTWVSGLFVDALGRERQPGGRRLGRPRLAAIATATIVCLAVSIGLAAWPGIAHQFNHSRATPRVAVRPAPAHTGASQGQTAAQPGQAGQAGTVPGTGGAPVDVPVQNVPSSSSSGSGQAQPVVAPPPAQPPPATTTNPTQQQQASQPAPQPPPPAVTFASSEVIGLGSPTFTRTGTWNTNQRGGSPDFSTPIFWTGDQSATATWSLGSPGGGQRWDQTRVRVWVPDPLGGAVVRYTVHWPTFSSNAQSFDVAQETTNNWHELGVFNIGTATQRTGSIWVVMTYVRPYPNPSDPACPNGSCWSMGASGVEFAWS